MLKVLYEEIASDEGKVLHPYLCSEGHPTIGIGHKILHTDPEASLPVRNAYDGAPEEESITEHDAMSCFKKMCNLPLMDAVGYMTIGKSYLKKPNMCL